MNRSRFGCGVSVGASEAREWDVCLAAGLKVSTNKGHLNPSGLNEINEASHLNGE